MSVKHGKYGEQEKKEEIWLSPMTKPLHPQKKSKTQSDNTKTPPKTSITQRLRTDLGRWVGVTIGTQLQWLNRFCRIPTFPLTAKAVKSKRRTFKNL